MYFNLEFSSLDAFERHSFDVSRFWTEAPLYEDPSAASLNRSNSGPDTLKRVGKEKANGQYVKRQVRYLYSVEGGVGLGGIIFK